MISSRLLFFYLHFIHFMHQTTHETLKYPPRKIDILFANHQQEEATVDMSRVHYGLRQFSGVAGSFIYFWSSLKCSLRSLDQIHDAHSHSPTNATPYTPSLCRFDPIRTYPRTLNKLELDSYAAVCRLKNEIHFSLSTDNNGDSTCCVFSFSRNVQRQQHNTAEQ